MPDQVFTSGQILTAAQMSSLQSNIGLVYLKSQTIGAAVTGVTVSDAFSTTYDHYRVIINGGAASATTENLNLSLGSTSTGYYWARNGRSFADVDNGGAAANDSKWRAGGANTTGLNMCVDIFSPFLADETIFTSTSIYMTTTGSMFNAQGFLNNTTSYTAFTVNVGSGTITGGTITLYGYRKA